MPGQADDDGRAALEELTSALQVFTVESDVFVDVFARAHGLGRSDLNAIMWISTAARSGQPLTLGELATRLGLGAPATTALVDRLEASGHLRRQRDHRDRRKVTLTMQDDALRLALDFFEPLGDRMAAVTADDPAHALRAAADVVRRITTAVTDARKAVSPP